MQTIREDSKVLAPLHQQLASKCPNAYSVMSLYYPPWIIACKAPLSMGFSKQEYLSRLPFPPSGVPSNPGIEPVSHTSLALATKSFTTSTAWEDCSESASHPVMSNSLQLHGL